MTVVAVPRLPALWHYAPLSGHATVSGLREDAVADAQRLRDASHDALPPTCSVEHRVLGAWSDVIGVLQHGAFHTVVLAVQPGRRALRMITAAGAASGTVVGDQLGRREDAMSEDHLGLIAQYYDACSTGDTDGVIATTTSDVVHYFLSPNPGAAPVRGGEHLGPLLAQGAPR